MKCVGVTVLLNMSQVTVFVLQMLRREQKASLSFVYTQALLVKRWLELKINCGHVTRVACQSELHCLFTCSLWTASADKCQEQLTASCGEKRIQNITSFSMVVFIDCCTGVCCCVCVVSLTEALATADTRGGSASQMIS